MVHPHPPRPGQAGDDRGRRRRGVALGRRPGRGTPSGTPSRPRNDLREAPTSTGKPSACTRSRWASSRQLCSAGLAKPNPGSSTICSRSDAARRTRSSTRPVSSRHTSWTTSSYDARDCMWVLCARQCMATYCTPESATTAAIPGSARPPLTSLTTLAPACRAWRGHVGAHGVDAETRAPAARARPPPGAPGAAPPARSAARRRAGWTPRPTSSRSAPCSSSSQAVRHRGGRLEPLAAVAEGVGGDVDHAHHQGAHANTLVSRRSEGQVRNASASSAAMATRGRSAVCG